MLLFNLVWITVSSSLCCTPGGTRTHNPLIRSQGPYPLGHKRMVLLFSFDVDHRFLCFVLHTWWDSNPQSLDQKSSALSNRPQPLGLITLVTMISITRNSNSPFPLSLCCMPYGTQTLNALIRSTLPYLLGHKRLVFFLC